ncbi:MAG: hypothetical protein AAF570_29575, partial [Bacteroidota bacterium]
SGLLDYSNGFPNRARIHSDLSGVDVTKVYAADDKTYHFLRKYLWPSNFWYDTQGNTTYQEHLNTGGYAYVRTEYLKRLGGKNDPFYANPDQLRPTNKSAGNQHTGSAGNDNGGSNTLPGTTPETTTLDSQENSTLSGGGHQFESTTTPITKSGSESVSVKKEVPPLKNGVPVFMEYFVDFGSSFDPMFVESLMEREVPMYGTLFLRDPSDSFPVFSFPAEFEITKYYDKDKGKVFIPKGEADENGRKEVSKASPHEDTSAVGESYATVRLKSRYEVALYDNEGKKRTLTITPKNYNWFFARRMWDYQRPMASMVIME